MWRNTRSSYGLVSILLHWIVAVLIVGLFGFGLWMVDLSYYDPWYNTAPAIHIAVGLLVGALLVVRLVWRLFSVRPAFEATLGRWERAGALTAHWLMYVLMFAVIAAGYLIPGAEGEPVKVFDWFSLPAIALGIERQADLAGQVHYYGAWALIVIAGMHTVAALKHHFVDRDRTLRKMLRPGP